MKYCIAGRMQLCMHLGRLAIVDEVHKFKKNKKISNNAKLSIVLLSRTKEGKFAQVNDRKFSNEAGVNLGLFTVFFSKSKYINLWFNFIIQMREGAVGVVFLSASLIQRQIKHFLEFLPSHKDVSVEERVATVLSNEMFHSAHCCHSIVSAIHDIDLVTASDIGNLSHRLKEDPHFVTNLRRAFTLSRIIEGPSQLSSC